MRLVVESQKRDSFSSFIVLAPQPVSYSFACHVSCKVKYYWKVAKVKVRFPGGDNVFSFSQLCRSMSPTNQLSAVDHCGSQTQSMKSCHEETNRSFSRHATKKYIGNRPVEEARKMKYFKRLVLKQFVQVSGLCGPKFLSYLPKRFMHLRRALYGDAILVHRFGAPIWPPEINKTSGVRFFYKSSFFSLEN